jgi:hypothetical protein
MLRTRFLFVAFIIVYYGVLFFHFSGQRLDGDIPNLMANSYQQEISKDPFGLKMLISGIKHANSNRYFSFQLQHAILSSVSFFTQNISSISFKIDFLYGYLAMVKIITHFLFCLLFSLLLSRKLNNLFMVSFLISSCFIQIKSWYGTFGLLDNAFTYVCFYGIPSVLFLGFVHLIIRLRNHWIYSSIIFVIGFVFCFFGSYTAPSLFLFLTLYLFYFFTIEKTKAPHFFAVILLIIISCYSMYVGSQNIETLPDQNSFVARYVLLLKGTFHLLFHKICFALVLGFGMFQIYFLRYKKILLSQKAKVIISALFIFGLGIYISLPLAGYRPYRPFYIRHDMFIPIAFCICAFVLILNQVAWRQKSMIYKTVLFLFVLVFHLANVFPWNITTNEVEKSVLERILSCPANTVVLKTTDELLSWDKVETWRVSEYQNTLKILGLLPASKKLVFE